MGHRPQQGAHHHAVRTERRLVQWSVPERAARREHPLKPHGIGRHLWPAKSGRHRLRSALSGSWRVVRARRRRRVAPTTAASAAGSAVDASGGV